MDTTCVASVERQGYPQHMLATQWRRDTQKQHH